MIQESCTLFSKAENSKVRIVTLTQDYLKIVSGKCSLAFLALRQNDTEHRSQLYPVDTKTPFGLLYTVIDCIIFELDIHLFTVIIGVRIYMYMHSRPQIHVQAVGLYKAFFVTVRAGTAYRHLFSK